MKIAMERHKRDIDAAWHELEEERRKLHEIQVRQAILEKTTEKKSNAALWMALAALAAILTLLGRIFIEAAP